MLRGDLMDSTMINTIVGIVGIACTIVGVIVGVIGKRSLDTANLIKNEVLIANSSSIQQAQTINNNGLDNHTVIDLAQDTATKCLAPLIDYFSNSYIITEYGIYRSPIVGRMILDVDTGSKTLGFCFSDFSNSSIRMGIFVNSILLNTSRISMLSILPYAIRPESYAFITKTIRLSSDSGVIWHSNDSVFWILRVISIDSENELVHFEIAKYENKISYTINQKC